ncbi:MAG: Ig-like domain-containing protein [Gemmatimonadetes bacterium]|nr:Ig-like domain-containing protein [Gemmatimonadota bacterium]
MTQRLTQPRIADRRPAITLLVASMALVATGCEKIVVRDPCVLTVSTSVASVPLERGQTAQVNATSVPTGTCTSQQRFWQSSNTAVAAVSGEGMITGVGAGTATITVTERDETYGTTGVALVTVTVTVPVLVAIPVTSPTIDLGAARQLTAIVSGASNPAVQWTSSAPDVVAVSATGVASALGIGVAIVTARSVAVPAKAAATTLTVAVSVAASPAEATMGVGEALPLTAFVLGAVNKQVTWRSSNSAVATVNASGLVTAVGPGTASVIATATAAPSRSGTATITVTGPTSFPAGLAHRWTFAQSGGAGTALLDDVGGAHATIVEVGASDAVAQGGGVTMAGGARNASDYVALPGGLLSRHSSATIEIWGRQISPRIWARIFDFGSGPTNYLFMSWTQDARLTLDRVEWNLHA